MRLLFAACVLALIGTAASAGPAPVADARVMDTRFIDAPLSGASIGDTRFATTARSVRSNTPPPQRAEVRPTTSARWTPTLRLQLQWRESVGGRRLLKANVRSSYTGRAHLDLRVRSGGRWVMVSTTSLRDGRRSFQVRPDLAWFAPGKRMQVRLRGDAARRTARAEARIPDVAPLELVLNVDPELQANAWLTRWADLHLRVVAGDVVNLWSEPSAPGGVTDPGGRAVELRPVAEHVWQFTARRSGTHTIAAGAEPFSWFFASTPKVVDVPFDQMVDVAPDVPGQDLAARFSADAGDAVALTQVDETASLLDPRGDVVPVWLQHWMTGDLYRLTESGSYSLHYGAGSRLAVWSVPVLDATVDGPAVTVERRSSSEDAVVVAVDNPQQLPWSLLGDCTQNPGAPVVFAPGGSTSFDWRVPQPEGGTYYLVYSGGSGGSGGAESESLQITSGTEVDLPVGGDRVTLTADAPGCTWLRGGFHADEGDVVWLDVDTYPSDFELLGPGGVVPGPHSLFWIIPETGHYSWDTAEPAGWEAQWSLGRGQVSEVVAGAGATSISFDESPYPDVIHVRAPTSSAVRLDVDAAAGGAWQMTVLDRYGVAVATPLDAAHASVEVSSVPEGGLYLVSWSNISPAPATVTATPLP